MAYLQLPDFAGRLLIKSLLSVLPAILVVIACSDSPAVENVSVERLMELSRADTSLYLLDVRTAGEYARSRLQFTRERIPHDSIKYALDRLPEDRRTSIYCLCAVGKRSGMAADYLKSIGYERVYNIEGGLKAWTDSGFEVVRD